MIRIIQFKKKNSELFIMKSGVAHCEPVFLVPSFDYHLIKKQY